MHDVTWFDRIKIFINLPLWDKSGLVKSWN